MKFKTGTHEKNLIYNKENELICCISPESGGKKHAEKLAQLLVDLYNAHIEKEAQS